MATDKPKAKRRPRQRKRRTLDEALRREGLDEVGYAEGLGGFFQELKAKPSVPKLKLMLDGLKELVRHLEPKRSASPGGDDAPMVVQLVHNVARPSRAETPQALAQPASPALCVKVNETQEK
ncbi:MAG: hypothetical protein ACRD4X_17330 [Candidatus Acidiferrales bacterium]